MDVIIEVAIFFVRKWRLSLMTLGAFVLAAVLAGNIAWFTGFYSIVLVLAGFVGGVFWQVASESILPGSIRKKRKV